MLHASCTQQHVSRRIYSDDTHGHTYRCRAGTINLLEEKCLAYVGVTRAMDRLFILSTKVGQHICDILITPWTSLRLIGYCHPIMHRSEFRKTLHNNSPPGFCPI